MNESILHLIGLIVGYVLIWNFVFKKKKGMKLSFRKRYDLRKKKMRNEED
jgi:hypothetical protein